MKKQILVVYNIFGPDNNSDWKFKSDQTLFEYKISVYQEGLNEMIRSIKHCGLQDKIRLVISAVHSGEKILKKLYEDYNDQGVTIFSYEDTSSPTYFYVQVSFNKTCLAAEKVFGEKYDKYVYLSSGLVPMIGSACEIESIDDSVGVWSFRSNFDSGEEGLGCDVLEGRVPYDRTKKYKVPPGRFMHTHFLSFDKSLREFYGVPMTDVHGIGGMEHCISFTAAALKKSYIITDTICYHRPAFDRMETNIVDRTLPEWDTSREMLLWGRKTQDIIDDKEAQKAGLGYVVGGWCPKTIHPPGPIVPVDMSKFDENYFAKDDRLKYFVKKHFFANKNELDYDNIKYVVYKK